jgi:heme oxygenase
MKSIQNRCTPPLAAESGGFRMRLRHSTETLHRRVEKHLDLLGRNWTPAAYCRLLETLRAIYAPIERRLTALDWSGSGIDVSARCKSHWLDADLADFGVDVESVQMTCTDLPRLESIASGLGTLYVLEGSTLGGQIILRTLRPQLAISSTHGGRFYASYGAQIGAMWRSYISVLENAAQLPQHASEIELGALETFGAFERWFSSQCDVHTNEPVNV